MLKGNCRKKDLTTCEKNPSSYKPAFSNNQFIPLIENNFKTPTNQNNEKRQVLPESTPNLPPNLDNKTSVKFKSI